MLSPDQFFHGTTHNIADGMVRPADHADKNVSEYSFGDPGNMSEGDHAFVIRNHEDYAWHAANTFHPSLRRSRVYEVGAADDMKPGPWNKEHPNYASHHWGEESVPNSQMDKEEVEAALREGQHQDEWGSKTGFPVKKRIDIMPGQQGTFPGISWGRFSEHPYHQGINHPSNEAVRYGHAGLDRVLDQAHKMNTPAPVEGRQPGQTLRDFMMGKPAPKPGEPNHPQGALF